MYMAPTEFSVEGMSCGGCEQNVEDAVGALDGVESVDADHVAGTVEVDGDVDSDDLRQAIEGAGYSFSG